MQNRAALKKRAIDNSIKELEKFKAIPLIGVALFHFKKIKSEEKDHTIEWSKENSENNLDVLDIPRGALVEALKQELNNPGEYPKDLCDSAHAVLVALTKYWPRNKYDEETGSPLCPLSYKDLTYDKQTQDFIFYTHDGYQLDLESCSSLKPDSNSKLRHPIANSPFIQRDLDYMNSLLTLWKIRHSGSRKAGAEIGAVLGLLFSIQMILIILTALANNPHSLLLASLTLSSGLLMAAAVIILPIISGLALGFIVGALIDIYYYFNSSSPNPKISQLLNSIESNIAPTPSAPVLSNNLINDKLLASPVQKPVAAEIKSEVKDSSNIKLPSPVPLNSARRKNQAWLDKVERRAVAARAVDLAVTERKREV